MDDILSQAGFSLLCAYYFISARLCKFYSIIILTAILQMIKVSNREVK